MLSVKDIDFDTDEIEHRKQLVRDLWAGKPVDHIPVMITVTDPQPKYSIREQFQDGDKQLEVAKSTVAHSWQSIRDGDYIPAMRPDVGCSGLATAFGAELFWGDNPEQTCGVKEPVLKDVAEAFDLVTPAADDGQLAEGTERIRRFAEAGQGLISVSLLDMAGGLNVASDLLGGEGLYLAMYENPEALECLLGKIQELFLAAIALQIEAAGGEDAITATDFPDTWFPEGRKGHVSDDISANISPQMYERFSLPYHNMVFEKYGGGGLHNCGPNPCLEYYLKHTPAPRAIDLTYENSRNDLPIIKKVCRKKAIIYLIEFPAQPQQALAAFGEIMELMTPDVMVIPVLTVTTEDAPAELYRRMRQIAEEYAKRMDWTRE
ncbi:MAG TPA: uroporphyrinogen decarboxylase family protein [Sedimentisphaerales bacterium]|nr:uroporphyrinogen decarboxylase family protein [Sedimentisphaerales bacterium]